MWQCDVKTSLYVAIITAKSDGFVVAASTDILLDMVSKLDNPEVALVHQMPYTTDHAGFAHAVEKVCIRSITVASVNSALC